MLTSNLRGTARTDVSSQRRYACRGALATPDAGTERTRIVGELGLSQAAQQWVNVTLIWIGFGTLAGLGIVGSVVGPLALCYLLKREDFNPIGPLGFLAAVGGALTCLLLYRVLVTLIPVEPREDLEE